MGRDPVPLGLHFVTSTQIRAWPQQESGFVTTFTPILSAPGQTPFPLHQAMCWGAQITQFHFLYRQSLQRAETSLPLLQLSFTASIPPPSLLLPPLLPFFLPSSPLHSFFPLIHPSVHPSTSSDLSTYLSYLPDSPVIWQRKRHIQKHFEEKNFSLIEGFPGSLTLQGLTR